MLLSREAQFLHYSGTFTDQYEIAMAQVYYHSGRKKDRAVFDYFFRKLPFGSGYCIFAGLHDLLKILETLTFTKEDLEYLRMGNLDEKLLSWFENFRFTGNIYACDEGEIIFPNEPVLRIEAPLIEAQLIETLLLNILNFQSLIATKASRVREAAGNKTLLEFGLRRAQGAGGHSATRAAIIGGFDGTSNAKAAMELNLRASGTMAHSYVQSEIDELTAFRNFVSVRPKDSVLLVDTYSTLNSGLPHAIQVAKEMEKKGEQLKGIRLDSGDLAYLSKECRKQLDENSLQYVKIVASNQLDEHVIQSLNEQQAPIDVYGVGTKLVTGAEDGALDGVYKLSEVNGNPKIKLSENLAKISLPAKKQIFRLFNEEGKFAGADAISLIQEMDFEKIYHASDPLSSLEIEKYKKVPLLECRMKNGKRTSPSPSVLQIRDHCRSRLALLPDEFKRFTNPHIYKVGLTHELKNLRDKLVREYREEIS